MIHYHPNSGSIETGNLETANPMAQAIDDWLESHNLKAKISPNFSQSFSSQQSGEWQVREVFANMDSAMGTFTLQDMVILRF